MKARNELPSKQTEPTAAVNGLLSAHLRVIVLLSALIVAAGCKTTPRPGTLAPRKGDEIVVAGKFVHTGTPVVLWTDPGGYDAYRVERRFSPIEKSDWETSKTEAKNLHSPNRYNMRKSGLSEEEIERMRGGGWDLPTLQKVVDQFVIHYDVAGTSRQCFKVMHDSRCLSVHFLLDIDGTIYQTLDLKERAWHATIANSRSVGIEIANLGAYRNFEKSPLPDWYKKDDEGNPRIVLPPRLGDGGVRTPDFIGRPARPEPVTGRVQGGQLTQYDFTPEQYKALSHLTAALCTVLPKIKCDYPRDAKGNLIPHKLADEVLETYGGVIGHYHIQSNKADPGPAFQWDLVIDNARKLMGPNTAKKPTRSAPVLCSPRQS